MTTLFISDLHLDPARPAITQLFLEFLRGEAVRAKALYILGDLFEAWIGDDDDSPLARAVAQGLAALAGHQVPVAFQHGNRDFLLGSTYAERAGIHLLPEYAVIDLYGEPTLLLHGDQLCTEDHAYQTTRQQLRHPAWQRQFLARSRDERRQIAAAARVSSRAHQSLADEAILDVHPPAVLTAFRQHGVRQMIHGHTHRPAVHTLDTEHGRCTRTVLGDWYTQGSVFRVDAAGGVLCPLTVPIPPIQRPRP